MPKYIVMAVVDAEDEQQAEDVIIQGVVMLSDVTLIGDPKAVHLADVL